MVKQRLSYQPILYIILKKVNNKIKLYSIPQQVTDARDKFNVTGYNLSAYNLPVIYKFIHIIKFNRCPLQSHVIKSKMQIVL